MVEIINSIEDLCRLCAGKIDVLMGLNIFASDHRQILKKICMCLPIQISVDDSFPKMVCVDCACKLDLMFDFRERSILAAHLFSDMLTISNGNPINVNENLSIGNEEVAEEPDFENDYITCKLDSVKYNTDLPAEMCADTNEKLVQQNVKLEETKDLVSKSKSKPKIRTLKKNLNDLQCEITQEMRQFSTGNSLNKKIYEISPHKEFQQTQHNLTNGLTDVNLSTEKFTEDSIICDSETTQNLNDCPGLDWFFCNVCNKTFEDKEAFELHNQEHLPKSEDKHVSEETSKISETENNNTNKKKKTKQKKTGKMKSGERKSESKVCIKCGKQFESNYKLQEHMRTHTGDKPFVCSYEDCRKTFRSKIGLAQHEANHSGKFEFSCSTCGKGFQCKSYLVVHQRVHSDLKPFICKQCSRKFKTKQSLLDHMNRHLGVKPFLCDICGRGFITKGLCKSHQKVHSGTDNRQYPCHVCRKLFVSKSYLNTHFRIHTGEKPFMCEVCGKGFLTRVDLRIHSTMHTGEKRFVCEMCGKAFARKDALRCHRRSHTGERPYKCEFCGQSFTQFSPMAIHKRLHTGERPYLCDVCSKSFVSRSTMIAHRKKHHATNNDESQFQFVAVQVQQEPLNGRTEETGEQVVVIENSPQLLLALSKRHSVITETSPEILPVNKLKNEGSAGVPVE